MKLGWIPAGAVCLLWGCSSAPPPAARKEEPAPVAPAKITQFYAVKPRIAKGETAQLCYGVDGAKQVELTPKAEEVWPAMSRCVDAKPASTTTYTLTARNEAGAAVTKTAVVEVGPAGAGAGQARLIQEVTVNRLEVAAGEAVSICYTAPGASSVKVTPGEGAGQAAARGCVVDKPVKTTTYVVSAAGAGGATDTERVTVKVR
ncbi:MAG: hypothetical protein JSU00_24650 [Acidobacteria bacterium]|nr:hypothetical protein [Acidobacteriota bacterium]